MKLIDEMSHEEIVALNSDDVRRMIKYICAQDGIKILPEPVEPKKPEFQPDIDAFELGNFFSLQRKPLDEIAEIVSRNRNHLRKDSYNWSIGSDYKFLELADYEIRQMTEVKPVKVFSKEYYDQISTELKEYTEAKKQYEEDLKEYKKYESERESATEWVWEKYHEAHREQLERDRLLARYKEYITVAEGDREVAIKFLVKAYAPTPERLNYVKNMEIQ